MAIDWASEMLDPIYAGLGVPATLLSPAGAELATLTVIDKTGGVETGEAIDVPTARPAAALRMRELAGHGLGRDDLDDGYLTFNGLTWRIVNAAPRPTPGGEAQGEVLAWLSGPVDAPEAPTEEPTEEATEAATELPTDG